MDDSEARQGTRGAISEKETLSFRIDNFVGRLTSLNLSENSMEDRKFVTHSFKAHSEKWRLLIVLRVVSTDLQVGFGLRRVLGKNSRDVTVHYIFDKGQNDDETGKHNFTQAENLTLCRFVQRSEILDGEFGRLDDDGTLFLDVSIQVCAPVWYPRFEKSPDWVKANMDSPEISDALVIASGAEFRLHRFVLKSKAPVLCESFAESSQPLTLENVDAETFRLLVEFLYSNEPPTLDSYETAKAVLLLADQYGCGDLKLFAESTIVDKYLEPSNAAERVLFGHDHSCALLKERAIEICSSHAPEVIGTEGWKQLKESSELVDEMYLASNTKPLPANPDHPERMSVPELRDELLKRKRDLDGSREMLIKRLKSE